jgi:hypothetical protein
VPFYPEVFLAEGNPELGVVTKKIGFLCEDSNDAACSSHVSGYLKDFLGCPTDEGVSGSHVREEFLNSLIGGSLYEIWMHEDREVHLPS